MSHIRVYELTGVRAVTQAASAADLQILAENAYCGKPVTADDVHIREMLLCHNQYGRPLERFPREYLERFAQTLPGKSVLAGHNWGELPLGRFFRAGLTTRKEAFPVPARTGKQAAGLPVAAELVPGFAEQETQVTWLLGGFYFANDPANEALRKNIDLGVYRSVSIGFRFDDLICDVCGKSYLFSDCPHIIGEQTEDGALVTATYGGDVSKAEALEGSIVYLGAQPQARLIKAAQAGETVDPEEVARTPYGEDLVTRKAAERLARCHGYAARSWSFPAIAKVTAQGVASEETEKGIQMGQEAKQGEAVETPAAQAAPEQVTPPPDPLAQVGRKALEDLRDAYLADSTRLGRNEAEIKEIADLLVEKGAYDRLKTLADAVHGEVLQKFPAGESADVKAATGQSEEREKLQSIGVLSMPEEQQQARRMEQKYAAHLEGLKAPRQRRMVAQLLWNQEQFTRTLAADTTTGDLAMPQNYAVQLIRKVYPALIATELCSVQPMQGPNGKVYYLDYAKQPVTTYLTAQAAAAATEITVASAYGLKVGDTLSIGADATLEQKTIASVVNNTITLTAGLTNQQAKNAVVERAYSTAKTTELGAIARAKLALTSADVSAEKYALAVGWSSEAAEDLRATHNLDAEQELINAISGEIVREIDGIILTELLAGATAGTVAWSATKGGDFTETEWRKTLYNAIVDANNAVFKKRYRDADFLVASPDTIGMLERLEEFKITDSNSRGSIGIQRLGVLNNRWDVYKAPQFAANQILVGIKGDGYVYAPYVPLSLTPLQYNTDTDAWERSIRTRAGRKLTVGDAYAKVQITP